MLVSIITPVFNREKTLLKSIQSVLSQTHQEFELILIDDNSTDNSVQIAKSIRDSRIKVLHHDINKGAAAARNTGVKKAQGELIAFLDSDDWYEETFLEKSIALHNSEKKSVGFTWCGVNYILPKREEAFIWKPERKESVYTTFLNALHIGIGCGVMVKREVFRTVGGFNENLPAAEDTAFFFSISKEYDYVVVDEVLINISKLGDDRLSTDYSKIALAYNQFIDEHLEPIRQNIDLSKKFFYKLGWLNYYLKDKSKARKYFRELKRVQGFRLKPFFIQTIFEVLPLKLAIKLHQRNF